MDHSAMETVFTTNGQRCEMAEDNFLRFSIGTALKKSNRITENDPEQISQLNFMQLQGSANS